MSGAVDSSPFRENKKVRLDAFGFYRTRMPSVLRTRCWPRPVCILFSLLTRLLDIALAGAVTAFLFTLEMWRFRGVTLTVRALPCWYGCSCHRFACLLATMQIVF